MSADRLDSRTWLVWGLAVIVPLLVARNPFVIGVVLIGVLAVRSVWSSRSHQGWQWIVRMSIVFMVVGVIFNALTVHSGTAVLWTVPDGIPIISGPVTLNAVVYGIVSGMAIVTLVLTGTTVAAGLVWADLMRSVPPRLAPIAVAGSVAWSFLPGASSAFREIRESQAARGHRLRGVRDLPALVVPLLGGGLERAIVMSEALEARGFGHSGAAASPSTLSRGMLVVAIGSGSLMAYAFAVGRFPLGFGALLCMAGCSLVAIRAGSVAGRVTTRYRESAWSRNDGIVAVISLLALLVFFWRNLAVPEAAIFNPYPRLEWPVTDLPMLLGLSLLTVPALIVPTVQEAS